MGISVNMSTTLQEIFDQCKLFTKLQNYFSVGQITGQPGAQIATNVNQMLLSKRMSWKFNEKDMSLGEGNFMVTQQGFQDILHAGATVFVLLNNTQGAGALPCGGVGVDLEPITVGNQTYGTFNPGTAGIVMDPSGTFFTVQTLDPHPFQAGNVGQSTFYLSGIKNPAYNSVWTFNSLSQTSGWSQGYQLLSVPDNQHLVLAPTSGQVATPITAIAKSGSTVTITVPNAMSAGDLMTIAGMTTNTTLNGTTVTLTAANATSVQFTLTASVTNGAETGTLLAAQSGAPGIFDFGWMASASMQDIDSTSFPVIQTPIDAVHRIAPAFSLTGDKPSFCMAQDYNNGVLRFRQSSPQGTYNFQINCVYQARAPKFSSPQDVFQWPNNLSYVLVEMCLAQAMKMAYGISAAETQLQMGAAMQAVQMALESEDQEANDMAITPLMTLMR